MTSLEFKTHLIRHLEDLLKESVDVDFTPPQGMSSSVFFIKTDKGSEYAIKFGESAGNDVPALNLILSKNLEIPVPKVITSFVFEGTSVVVLEKIDYPLLEAVPHQRLAEYIPSMVKVLRLLHEIHSNKFGLLVNDSNISWKSYLLNIFNGNNFDWNEIANRKGLDKNLILSSVEKILSKINSFEFVNRPFCLLHTDFNQRNLFVDLNSTKITGIIDWEDAMFADPIFDFARVRMFMWHFGLTTEVIKDYYTLMNYNQDEKDLENLYWLIRVIQYLAWYSEELTDFSLARIKLHQEFLREYKW